MEKIININFQGRVIPIEETAYTSLKQYIDSLRRHFAHEESGDEIINDIENRIAELLSDKLKHGKACIMATDVQAVVDSIGRLEDIEAAEGEEIPDAKAGSRSAAGSRQPRGRFFRNADNKVIAGVCSGIADRMGIDPIIVRILFVFLFGGLFFLYLLLWVIVPSQSEQTAITRRLFRNPEDKMIAGVCGGLATYFRVDSWVPRLIFALPLIVSILFGVSNAFWWHWWGHRVFTGSVGSTLFICYIVFWIAVPYANSASDLLEMRGEKVDMNSIKVAAQAKAGAGATQQRRTGSGLARAIGILFKAFFLFLAGVMALSLFGVLVGLFFTGMAVFPFSDFLFDGWQQNVLVWAAIALFLGIPFLALITWLVRRLIGVRTRRHYLGYVFSGLWFAGFVSILAFLAILINNFGSKSVVENNWPIDQPTIGKLYVNVSNDPIPGLSPRYSNWFGDVNDNGSPFQFISRDTMLLNTAKVKIEQSADSLFHMNVFRISRGNTAANAKELASHITFNVRQQDSIITLPKRFAVGSKDKFRNQQVLIVIDVPMGKKVQFNKYIHDYDWFTVNVNGNRNYYMERNWEDNWYYKSNREYLMTPRGLMNVEDSSIAGSGYDEDDDDEEDN